MPSSLSFSDLPERWRDLLEFPSYSVSDHGRVLNTRTGFYLTPTRNSRGLAIVGLMRSSVQHKRSLGLLVADAFLSKLDNLAFNTPINLDGDRMNNHYTNLAWRPLWFARKYSQQFTDGHPTFEYPIEDIETRVIYPNSMDASVANGLLDVEIYLAMVNNTYVWPTGQIFREAFKR